MDNCPEPSFTIIIVNWNTGDLLSSCLTSIMKNIDPLDQLKTEIIVVDNGSSDDSIQLVQTHFPWVKLIRNEQNVGFARANNQGIAANNAEYIVLLNSDTIIHESALYLLLDFMKTHPEAGVCGPRLINQDGTLQPSCYPMLTPEKEFWRLLFLDRIYPKASYPLNDWDMMSSKQVEVLKGACLMLRRTALNEVGLLDEQYFMYSEEIDLCYRMAQLGWQIWYIPSSVVTHFGAASSSKMQEQMYLELYRSKVKFYRKTGGNRRAWLFKTLMALAYTPRAILKPQIGTYRRLLVELPKM